MTALPTTDKCGLDKHGCNVWNVLLHAEETALNLNHTNAKYNDPLIAIRVVGFFLKDFSDHAHDGYLGFKPYSQMATKIESCLNRKDENAVFDALVELGLRYRNHLIRAFYSHTGGRHTPSQNDSRPSFDVVMGRILEDLDKLPQTRQNTRKQALLRDGYRCVITGIYDSQSCFDIDEIEARSDDPGSPGVMPTEVAHIFSESAQDGDEDHAAAVFAMLNLFGAEDRVKALCNELNGLHNVITLAIPLQVEFARFNLWLEPVPGEENSYEVCGRIVGRFALPLPPRVTFSVEPDAADAAAAMSKTFKLPDPVLVAIRAACARVANLSGALDQINQILGDLEDSTVLADDGSMAELLHSRLLASMPSQLVDVHE